MAQNTAKVIRDYGTLSIGGVDPGFTSDVRGGLFLDIVFHTTPLYVHERGKTKIAIKYMGMDVTCTIYLAQHDAVTYDIAFQQFFATATATLNVSGKVAGEDMESKALVFTGQKVRLTANKAICRVDNQTMRLSLDENNDVPLICEFLPHSDGVLCTLELL